MIKMMTTREKELQMVKKRDIFCFEVLCENKENYNMSECTSKKGYSLRSEISVGDFELT
jgi:hypothetical protein